MTVTVRGVVLTIAIVALAAFVVSVLLYAWLSAPGGGSLIIS